HAHSGPDPPEDEGGGPGAPRDGVARREARRAGERCQGGARDHAYASEGEHVAERGEGWVEAQPAEPPGSTPGRQGSCRGRRGGEGKRRALGEVGGEVRRDGGKEHLRTPAHERREPDPGGRPRQPR